MLLPNKSNNPKLSPDEYFKWEARQEIRYEYINGEVFAMAGGTIDHSTIAANLIALLRPHVRGRNCRVLGSDAKVGISKSGEFFYPDLLVTCDDRDRNSTKAIFYPTLIIEVLSPSTEAYNRGGIAVFSWPYAIKSKFFKHFRSLILPMLM